MRRACLVLIAIAGLVAPSAARGSVLDTYQRIASRHLSPAPLVPTVVPPSLRPLDRTADLGTTRGGRGYSLRLVHFGPGGPDAVLVVSGGEFRKMKALLRDHRHVGFGAPKRTRIRGRRGYLLTRRLGPVSRTLAWTEGGTVYAVSSGTPKKVTLAQLRATARGLDRLERDWIGTSDNPESSSEGLAVTTRRTVTIDVTFEANCVPPESPDATTVRAGQAGVTLMRRNGNSFAFDIAQNRRDEAPWTGTVTGTIAQDAITVQVRAAGTIDGDVCDSGPLTLRLDRRLR
jgi:hypothetical protein